MTCCAAVPDSHRNCQNHKTRGACLRGFDRWSLLSGHCYAIPCRAVDGFRKPSPLQLSGLCRPRPSTGCPGFGGRLMHHHLAGLANALFFFLLGSVGCVGFVSGQNCPDDPCRFIRHSDSRQARWFSLQQQYQPLTCALWVRLGLSDERCHANNEQ